MVQSTTFNPMDSLREEHQALAKLIELMKAEQAHLIAANIEGLQEVNEQKAKIVSKASEMAQNRHRALALAGFEPKEEHMQAWLASINQNNVCQAWEQLLDITRSAKELNRVNGMLINKHLARNQDALNTLHPPEQAGIQNTVYGPNGHTRGNISSRRFVVG
jgi:flagellar biosynthesis protein FlgN